MKLVFVLRQLGLLILVLGVAMGAAAAWGIADYYLLGDVSGDEGPGVVALGIGSTAALVIGACLVLTTRRVGGLLERREALLLVVLSWLAAAVIGAIPYYAWVHADPQIDASQHAFGSPIACIFEAMSGLTTTGATVLSDVERLPRSLLLWRALTHWLGGLGIVVLFVAVLPSLGVSGRKLYRVESPGIEPGGVTPHIRQTARALWYIYSGLTLACILAFHFAGMGWFDATCHAFATLATGGFSTRNASLGAYTPAIQWIAVVFMVIAGLNFGLMHAVFRSRVRDVLRDPELRVYLVIVLGSIALLTLWLWGRPIVATSGEMLDPTAHTTLREAAFNVAAIQTTTGFGTSDFNLWDAAPKFLLVTLMFIGGCAGSTAGGIKVVRIWIGIKILINEVERVFRPNLIRPVRLAGTPIDAPLRTATVVYIVGVVTMFVVGTFGVLILENGEISLATATTASIACLCTIGPGLDGIGPIENYGWMSDSTKALLIFIMMMGRLEVLPVLVLLVPSFWRGE